MIDNPETLYKLMILYMLDKVSHPLTNSQLSGFFLDREYTTYFTLQRVLSELAESHFISTRRVGNSTHYEISEDGCAALKFFLSDISGAAKADMDKYLDENKLSLRSESMMSAEYYENPEGDYTVHCAVRENKSTVFALDLNVPDLDSAEDIAANWQGKSSRIYAFLMRTLLEGDEDTDN